MESQIIKHPHYFSYDVYLEPLILHSEIEICTLQPLLDEERECATKQSQTFKQTRRDPSPGVQEEKGEFMARHL